MLIADFIFTFVLAFGVITVAAVNSSLSQFFGLASGMCVADVIRAPVFATAIDVRQVAPAFISYAEYVRSSASLQVFGLLVALPLALGINNLLDSKALAFIWYSRLPVKPLRASPTSVSSKRPLTLERPLPTLLIKQHWQRSCTPSCYVSWFSTLQCARCMMARTSSTVSRLASLRQQVHTAAAAAYVSIMLAIGCAASRPAFA